MQWLPVLLTAGELVVGTLIIRFGTQPTIAYLLLALLTSTFSSFFVNAALRA